MSANRQKEKRQSAKKSERGNALIYVLIAIALFAALSMTLGRQTDTGEAGILDDEQAELYATQIINYAAQAKSSVDQMLFTGARIDNLDFTAPTDAAFNTPPNYNKVYHPDGGGLIPGRLPAEAIAQSNTNPVPGWYMGRFNNVEWTASASEEVILTAYQISEQVCGLINKKITGNTTIPVMSNSIRNTLIDDSVHSGTNVELTTDPTGSPICAECHKIGSLCVENQAQDAYAFYTIIEDQ